LRLLYRQPFTARQNLRLALAQYNRAAELGAAHDADLGRARALLGLGESQRAVQIATQVVAGSPRPGAALEGLLAAHQGAHDFTSAEDVARRLDRAGPASYPKPAAFYPRPTDSFDTSLPLSMGADTLAPLHDALVPVGGAGGTAQDLSFIPQYRDDGSVTDTLTDCPSLASRRDASLAGHAARALEDWPKQFKGARPGAVNYECDGYHHLRSIAELVAQRPITETAVSKDDLTDEWQNLLRWAGDLPGARKVISTWAAADRDRSPLPALRLGEVAFLQHDYNEAAAQFDIAARHTRLLHYYNDLAVFQAQLNRGAALFAAGRNAEAVAVLRPLEQLGTQGYAIQTEAKHTESAAGFAAVSYFASEQLADYESKTGDLHAAVDDYTAAVSWTTQLDGRGVRPEVLYNNLAMAHLGLGATDTAATEVANALESDPMNPIFLMTAGFIADHAGKTAEAADYDRRALQSDPGAFPAANDLGVELARAHDDTAAEAALRQAIGAEPGYALGWFNLGVLEGRRGPLHLPASQGAFAKAFALDPTLKDRRHDLTIDGSVYRTNLDLSKPLPPRWSVAETQKVAPAATAGLLAVLLVAAGLARSSSRGGADLAKQWLEPLAAGLGRIRGPKWLQRAAWAVVATVVAFLLGYLRHAGSPTEVGAYALGVILLAAVAMYARIAIAARTKIAATQRSWPPGMAFGLVTGAIGFPWAPLPVVKTSAESKRIHLAAPLTLAALTILLFAESAWLNVPLTQSFAVAALVMAGSTLLPIDPLDGANVGKAGVAAAAGVVGGAVLVALGLI
jgi:tetratricopeptide (TPR) repeat protein